MLTSRLILGVAKDFEVVQGVKRVIALEESEIDPTEQWEDDWEESERGRRFRSIDEVFPFSSFRKRTHALTRSQASLMIQLRSGHIPLNGYLSRINRADSDLCQACLEEDENFQCRETVKHFLFECTAYNKEREELTKQVSRRHLNLKDIMSDADRMKALAQYVNRTGRFKEKQQG